MNKEELYTSVVCALLHNMDACKKCQKCKGQNFARKRMNLVRELSKYFDMPLPWKETKNENDN